MSRVFAGLVFLVVGWSSQPLVARVHLGIDVLEARNFDVLKGKRVGLITNATGVDSRGESTVDLLRRAPGIQLVALFGPEHGVYGADYAGAPVAGSTDAHTGLPVFSLYGKTKKPTPEMLKNIDVLVYDIQDIGCRSYTFISTLGLAMEAAGENHVEFCVLDRPDPLTGRRVEGPMLDPAFRSFVGQWEIPYVYGLTPGELSLMIVGQKWITVAPKLTVIPMSGWYRDMYWDETGLMWIPTSPHIPTAESALDYAVTGMLGEAGGICHGIGYTLPFGVVGHPSFDSFKITEELSALPIRGILFRPITFKPFYAGFKDRVVHGSELFYTDRDAVNLTNLGVYLLDTFYHKPNIYMFQPDPSGEDGPDAFDKEAGSDALRKAIMAGKTPEEIIASWQPALEKYRDMRADYLLANYTRPEPPEPPRILDSVALGTPTNATTKPQTMQVISHVATAPKKKRRHISPIPITVERAAPTPTPSPLPTAAGAVAPTTGISSATAPSGFPPLTPAPSGLAFPESAPSPVPTSIPTPTLNAEAPEIPPSGPSDQKK